MAENEEKIVLTLGEEKAEEVVEEVKEEEVEKEKEHASVPVSDVVGYAKLDDSSLSDEEKKMVEDFSKQIDVMDTHTVLQYGATAQSKVADFSDTALKNVRTKDIDTVGDTLLDLVSQLRNFEVDDKNDNFFAKIFKKSSNSINDVKAKYDSANANVDKIVKILENHQITLMKDISLLDQLYEKNLVNFKELTVGTEHFFANFKILESPGYLVVMDDTPKTDDTNQQDDEQIPHVEEIVQILIGLDDDDSAVIVGKTVLQEQVDQIDDKQHDEGQRRGQQLEGGTCADVVVVHIINNV